MHDVRDMEAEAARRAALPPEVRDQEDRALFAHRAGLGLEPPWRPIADAVKDNRLYILLVDYTDETNAAAKAKWEAEGYVWAPNPLDDAFHARTIGHNNFDNDGEDVWQFAGWCWSQDHYTQGRGTPVACIELAAVAPMAGDDRDFMREAFGRVLAERVRQVEVERWSPEHDAKHRDGELALAGAAYAVQSVMETRSAAVRDRLWNALVVFWPWAWSWWKPKGALRDLERAGALIVAEIERRLRGRPS